jgi:hypothetical protein
LELREPARLMGVAAKPDAHEPDRHPPG